MNKKGFTLIELLATITIIGIVMILLFPSIRNVISNSEDNQNKQVVKVLISAADKYIADEKIDFKCYSKDSTQNSNLNRTYYNCLKFGNAELSNYISSYKVRNVTFELSTNNVYVYCKSGKKTYTVTFDYKLQNEEDPKNYLYNRRPDSCVYNINYVK